ncbi:hypothetical protein AB4371_16140 [Vibrio sp. 10N.261.51.A3]|uniref:hypothetical protein n=1 Tax=Vibrio TaxID=662 RepID=UPI000C85B7CB|nr:MULTISPECIES: hypothetical protein [Vibrio]PMF60319.1 hypothetical protein BCV12_21095 [Vibrio cyclitrophicus]TKF90166.1 hypothetical protein FCV73_14045 [Vibrio sp. F13]
MVKVFEFEVPNNYESVACRLEDILSKVACPIAKEKIVMVHLNKVDPCRFGLYVRHYEPRYMNVYETMGLYFSHNVSKQELLSKKHKTKQLIGNIITKYNSDMNDDMRNDLQRAFNKA